MSNKPNANKYSREIFLPGEVSKKYREYCRLTRMKLSEPLRVMVMESTPQLHNETNLDQVISKTKNRNLYDEYMKYSVRLPEDVVNEINTYCRFFNIQRRRCYFLYFLIEERLLKTIEEVLENGKN